MVTAGDWLAQYGISVENARDFIMGNIDKPHEIYKTCAEFGVSFQMLAEIYGNDVSERDVKSFFLSKTMEVSGSHPVWDEAYRTGDYTSMYWSDFKQDDHWDVSDGGATVLQLGTAYTGSFDYEGDRDIFSISLQAGEKYTLTTTNIIDFNHADDESYSASVTLETADNSGLVDVVLARAGETGQYTFEAPGSGRYFIELLGSTAHDGQINHYGLQMDTAVSHDDDFPDFLDSSATDITVGQRVSGVVDLNGDRDVFELQLIQGQTYSVAIENPAQAGKEADALQTLMVSVEVQQESETEFVESSMVIQNMGNSMSFQAEQTGTYYVSVRNMFDSFGGSEEGGNPYAFTVSTSSGGQSFSVLAGVSVLQDTDTLL